MVMCIAETDRKRKKRKEVPRSHLHSALYLVDAMRAYRLHSVPCLRLCDVAIFDRPSASRVADAYPCEICGTAVICSTGKVRLSCRHLILRKGMLSKAVKLAVLVTRRDDIAGQDKIKQKRETHHKRSRQLKVLDSS